MFNAVEKRYLRRTREALKISLHIEARLDSVSFYDQLCLSEGAVAVFIPCSFKVELYELKGTD